MNLINSLTLAALVLTGGMAPAFAADLGGTVVIGTHLTEGTTAADTVDRRRPRVPGGSGCDDPRDLIEHPECRIIRR